MDIKGVIRTAMATRGYNQAVVAEKAGWKSQSSLSMAINRPNPSMETVFRILDALDFEIIIKDKNSDTSWRVDEV